MEDLERGVALGALLAAQAAIEAAIAVVRRAEPAPVALDPDAPCAHPSTEALPAMGDGPTQQLCLLCHEVL